MPAGPPPATTQVQVNDCAKGVSVAPAGNPADGSGHQNILDPDRQLAQALAGGVIDRIGDRRGGSHIGELAQPFDAGRIDVVILLRDQDDFKLLDVGIHRHAVVGEVVVDIARALRVDLGRLVQGLAARRVRGLRIRPAAKAPTMRGTRISRVNAWILTSTNSAPSAYISFSPSGPPVPRLLP